MGEDYKWMIEIIIIPLIVAVWVSLREGQKNANNTIKEKIDEMGAWLNKVELRVDDKVSLAVHKEMLAQQYRELITLFNMADDAQTKKDLQSLRERVAVLEAELQKE